ncbi:MAG: crossover junction endodeoxyribonuclease RuvC [Steroidobacteraceae bacterium]
MRRLRRPRSLAELGIADPDSNGRAAVPRPAEATAARSRERVLPSQVRILGLDPGSLRTGYAVVESNAGHVAYVVSGTIRTEGTSLTERLQEIFIAVERLTQDFRPDEVAIEGVFMHRNPDSALKLGQARGAALSATFSARPRVFEYAPRAVKLAVVGTGSAQKDQVQLMVKRLLNISGPLGADAADALAIALCHAHSRKVHSLLGRAR